MLISELYESSDEKSPMPKKHSAEDRYSDNPKQNLKNCRVVQMLRASGVPMSFHNMRADGDGMFINNHTASKIFANYEKMGLVINRPVSNGTMFIQDPKDNSITLAIDKELPDEDSEGYLIWIQQDDEEE